MVFDPSYDLLTGKKKRTRKRLTQTEWEAMKKRYGNKCLMCGKSEKSVGKLQQAHILAHSKGGTDIVPLCPNCHTKYDDGLATATELRRLGIDKKVYKRLIPKKGKPKERNPFDVPTIKVPTSLGTSSNRRKKRTSSTKKSSTTKSKAKTKTKKTTSKKTKKRTSSRKKKDDFWSIL